MAHKLFVGSIPADVQQEELKMVFGTYGTVVDAHIMGGKSTSGQACAFIVYDRRESGETAIASLNDLYCFRQDGSKPIQVSWAKQGGGPGRPPAQAPTAPQVGVPSWGAGQGLPGQGLPGQGMPGLGPPIGQGPPIGSYAAPVASIMGGFGGCAGGGSPPAPSAPSLMRQNTKLFVGNLPPDILPEALNMVFSHYGTVTNTHIMQGKSKSGQACAFVEYSTPLEAETAVLTLHEKYEIRPGDGVIIVKHANNNSQNRPAPY